MKSNQEEVKEQLLDALLHEQKRCDREQAIAKIETAIGDAAESRCKNVRTTGSKRLGVIAASIAFIGITVFWIGSFKRDEIETATLTTDKSFVEERAETETETEAAIRELEQKIENSRIALRYLTTTADIKSDRESVRNNVYTIHKSETLEEEIVQLKNQKSGLLRYKGEQLRIYASGIDMPGSVIKVLYPQYLELKDQINGLKSSGMGERHPTIVTNMRVLDSMKKDIDEGVVNLRARLESQIEAVERHLATMEKTRNGGNLKSPDVSIDSRDYLEVKRELDADLDRLERLLRKQR
ncbi:MAG: hypothetical protein ACSHX7_02835 [Luteolibacter sp.]